MLAVNTYDEFLKLVEVIADSYNPRPDHRFHDEPGVLVLVGPSGGNKNEIAKQILKKSRSFQKLTSYTTDATVGMQGGEQYHYLSVEAFRKMCHSCRTRPFSHEKKYSSGCAEEGNSSPGRVSPRPAQVA